MEGRLETVRVAHSWKADPEGRRRAVAWTVRRKLVPLLLEYFHEQWRKADIVLGIPGLFVSHKPADGAAYYDEVADVSDVTSFDLAAWSDATDGTAYDDKRVAASFQKPIVVS